MEKDVSKSEFLDNDILNVIQKISFVTQSLLKCGRERQDLEKEIIKLNNELLDHRESAKLQTKHLEESKQLIIDQQTAISKLVAIKDEVKRYKEDISKREKRIHDLEQEKNDSYNCHKVQERRLEEESNKKCNSLKHEYEIQVQNLKNEILVLTSNSVSNIKRMDEEKLLLNAEKDETINRLVLEYEEKLQRAHAQYVRMKDEMRALIDKNKNKADFSEQRQVQRTNIVAPNVIRGNTVFQSESSTSFDSRCIRNQPGADLTKKLSNPGPYKLLPKASAPNQNFKPLQIIVTPSVTSNTANERPTKRKLFSSNLDEFQETD